MLNEERQSVLGSYAVTGAWGRALHAALGRPVAVAAAVTALVMLPGLGAAPWLDPPEGFHVEIAHEMAERGDWITPRLNGVRYFSKPPLPYWLMQLSFIPAGATPFAARLWPALAAVGAAALTARLGSMLGGPRLGVLAGLMTGLNLGVFVFARIVKPDMLLVLCITAAFTGLVAAYTTRRRWPLGVFYGALGVAVIAKDILGALGPLAVAAVFLWSVGERSLRTWVPWWGVVLFVAPWLPWYAAVEVRNPGFLWFTFVDVHLLNFAGRRAFPDEDVPLGTLEFLAVTAVAFLPWSLAVPFGAARTLSRGAAGDRVAATWRLHLLWVVAVIGVFAVSRFKLPHYAFPAFPALALLAARAWDEAIGGGTGARRLLVPSAVLFAVLAAAVVAAMAGALPMTREALETADLASRNATAHGRALDREPIGVPPGLLPPLAAVVVVATGALAVAAWRRAAAAGAAVLIGATAAFLLVSGKGLEGVASVRSAARIETALLERLRPGDVVVHEGPLENSASMLLRLRRPVPVVDGLQSNLAFGATFPDARPLIWDRAQLAEAWGAGTVFLVSVVAPERSAARELTPVTLVAAAAGRRLYTNFADR
ncbi:MAG TPA: glycosyltransferase family 39 protein [Methylomirabilota bacterium]|nr:glycosyltransferase family 39 protein [Methylomirabilota bacterium]